MPQPYNKVLIIGNGFDLNLGRPTSYAEFIQSSAFKDLLNTQEKFGEKPNKNMLAHHLKDRASIQNWIDLEIELSTYANKDRSIYEDGYGNLRSEYQSLKTALLDYLNKLPKIQIQEHGNKMAYKIMLNLKELDNVLILDFNYTDTIQEFVRELTLDQRVEHKHVHGIAESGDIVLGVHDGAVSIDNSYLEKSRSNSYLSQNNITSILTTAKCVEIFGHSLGETDNAYFKQYMRNLVEGEKTNHELTIWHYGEDGADSIHREIVRLTDSRRANLKQNIDLKFRDSQASSLKMS